MAAGLAGLVKGGAIGVTLAMAGAITLATQFAPRAPPLPAETPAPAPVLTELVVPVAGVTRRALSDTFDQARAEGRRHDAIDIMAPRGTPVIAAAAGKVEKLFLSAAGGNTIYVRLPDRTTIHYYAHLDGYAPGLREGQSVRQGERLGSVGSTGNADPAAPHLHFAILDAAGKRWWEATGAINPYPLLAGE